MHPCRNCSARTTFSLSMVIDYPLCNSCKLQRGIQSITNKRTFDGSIQRSPFELRIVEAIFELKHEGYPFNTPTCQVPVKTGWKELQYMDVGVLYNKRPLYIEYDDKSHLDGSVQVRDGFKTAWAQEHHIPLIRITYWNTTVLHMKNCILDGLAVRGLLTEYSS